MYASHFGLRTEPFSLTPDPSFFYLSPDHAEALAGLKIGLENRRGLMLMIARSVGPLSSYASMRSRYARTSCVHVIAPDASAP